MDTVTRYKLNGHNKCPRCGIGIIIPDWRRRVCLCCGLSTDDVTTRADMIKDALVLWLVRNNTHEPAPDFSRTGAK